MNIIITLLILGIIILIHELGHFLTAKYYKMPVAEFAIGMGPKLFSYHGKYTDYSIRVIPIGGFVNIEGMDIDNPVENGFNSKKAHERFVVLFAGVFMNFVLALLVMLGLSLASGGEYTPRNEAVIGRVLEGTPADGILKDGDIITHLNGVEINSWDDITVNNSSVEVAELDIRVNRNGESLDLNLEMIYNERLGLYLIGIQPNFDFRPYDTGEAINAGFKEYKNLFTGVFSGLKMLFTGQVKGEDMAGPVGLVSIVGGFTAGGLSTLMYLLALLSVNIGILNLLPFPALDGGRIIFVLLELIGVNVNKKVEEKIHYLGMLILLVLIFLITANDIKNIFR